MLLMSVLSIHCEGALNVLWLDHYRHYEGAVDVKQNELLFH